MNMFVYFVYVDGVLVGKVSQVEFATSLVNIISQVSPKSETFAVLKVLVDADWKEINQEDILSDFDTTA